MPLSGIAIEKRSDLLARLSEARNQTDRLFEIVKPDFLYERPIPERHRIVFYLGHLEAFDWNLLRERLLDLPSFDETFDKLFAFGIDPVAGGLPTDVAADWPRIPQVREYNRKIRDRLDGALAKLDVSSTESDGAPRPGVLLNVAIEHRLMHAETLAYMFHQLPIEHKVLQADAPAAEDSLVPAGMVEVPAGAATLGLARDDARAPFGWDNEFNMHSAAVPAFEIDRYKVTNGEYLEFMKAGGYENRSFWTGEDWKWKAESNLNHPAFWTRHDGGWYYRGMFGEFPLPLNWPVYVSHAEASAYARWAGKALPTEPQWHHAAYGSLQGAARLYPWGNEPPLASRGNFDFGRWEPAPVNAHPEGQSAWGVEDMLGNGWEWTSSLFGPFPGFEPFAFYPGYSANFFDGKHFVMKGGSARTGACMLRRSFRNWFQVHYPYIYAGFRCVRA